MALMTMEELKEKPSLQFPKENDIGFFMDFAFFRGIPSDRIFYVAGDAPHDSLNLIAPGYGLRGDYGNGSIFVSRKDVFGLRIPETKSPTPFLMPG